MAFEMIEKYRIYICQSTDIKKTDNIEEGSFLFETDTKKRYMFNGTAWVEFPEMIEVSEASKVKIWDGTDTADVISTNGNQGLVTISPNHFSTVNATTTPLGIDGVFTGTGEETTNYADITITVQADQASATDGLEMQFSHDNITWSTTDRYTIPANKCKPFSLSAIGKYFRVKYTNGGVAQTEFDLCVRFNVTSAKPSSHRIDEAISGQDDAELQKAVITGKRADGLFDNVSLTNGSNMKISLEELESGISSNSNSQLNVTLFGVDGEAVYVTDDSLCTITHAHKEVHSGSHYITGHLFTAVANNANADFRIVNGSTKEIHLIITGIVEAKAYGYLYEGTTYTDPGTSNGIVNNNRNSSNTSTATVYYAPTVDTLGTAIYPEFLIPAGTKSAAIGGNASNGQEIILKPSTDYLIRLTSKAGAGATNDMQILCEWYEETI